LLLLPLPTVVGVVLLRQVRVRVGLQRVCPVSSQHSGRMLACQADEGGGQLLLPLLLLKKALLMVVLGMRVQRMLVYC
jgi:hypothetical protein